MRRRKELRLSDEDVRALQVMILTDPSAAPVIPGTGGVRKMRFSPPSEARGKRGAYRVLYAHFPKHEAVALFTIYLKNEQDDISPADRKQFHNLIALLEQESVGQYTAWE